MGGTMLNWFLTGGGTALLDLSGLDASPQSPPSFPEFPTPTDSLNPPSQDMGISLLDDELMSLGNKHTRKHTTSYAGLIKVLTF